MRHLVAVLITTACSQQVYSPPSRAFSLQPLAALPQGGRALDLELSHHAQIFDPGINAGAARLRVGVGDNIEVSAEGTALAVDDHGPSRADRRLYAGRGGISVTPGKGGLTLFAGLGGGYAPAGGAFAAADAGISVGYHNCVLVPIVEASGFISNPLEPRPIDVTDDEYDTFDTPQRTVGGSVRAGLRLGLQRAACRRGAQSSWLYAGFSFTSLADQDSSAGLLGVGVGLTIPL